MGIDQFILLVVNVFIQLISTFRKPPPTQELLIVYIIVNEKDIPQFFQDVPFSERFQNVSTIK